MRSKTMSGVVAGLGAGVIFGVMMQMMTAPTPEGGRMPMMGMVAQVVRSESLVAGWIYHLVNSAAIGALFGWLLGGRVHGYINGATWGLLYGAFWWVLGGLILMPLALGMPAFAPLRMPEMQPVAMGSLMGHAIYGLFLGGGFAFLLRHAADAARRGPLGYPANKTF